MRLDDEILISRCLSGDQAAFTFLVNKYKEMVHAYAYHKLGDYQEAEDIAQEVFTKAYRKLGQLKSPHRFQSWLYTIVSNECKMWLRKHSKEREKNTHLEDVSADEFTELAMRTHSDEETKFTVQNAMKTLPADNQLVLSLYYMSDLSVKEIAHFMGISSNTVKGKLHRARKQLGERLRKMVRKQLKTEKLNSGFIFTMVDSIKSLPIPSVPKPKIAGDGGVKWAPIPITVALLVGIIGFGLPFGGGISSDTPVFESVEGRSAPSLEVSLFSSFDEQGVLNMKSGGENKVTAPQDTSENRGFASQNIDALQQFIDEEVKDLPKLSTGNSISGTVYHADGVTPFKDAFVYLRRYGRDSLDLFKPVRTDASGRYEFINLPLTPHHELKLYVSYPDFESVKYDIGHENEVVQKDFVLRPAASISGKVIGVENTTQIYLKLETDEHKFPYRRAYACCAVEPGGSYRYTLTTSEFESYGVENAKQSRQKSEFYWPKGLPDSAVFTVTARVKGYEAVTIPNVRIIRGRNTPNVNIHPVEHTGSISGRVIGEDGALMSGVRLRLHDADVSPDCIVTNDISKITHIAMCTEGSEEHNGGYFDLLETESDFHGAFRFDDVPTSTYRLYIVNMPGKVGETRILVPIPPTLWQNIDFFLMMRGENCQDIEVIVKPELGPTDVVGMWLFDESSGKNAKDSSGNGNHGTLHGGQRVQGIFGNALKLNGVNEFVEVPDSDSLDLLEQVTLMCWFNWAGSGDAWQTLLAKAPYCPMPGTYENWGLEINTTKHLAHPDEGNLNIYRHPDYKEGITSEGNIRFTVSGGGGRNVSQLANRYFAPDKWCHVAATYDGRVKRIYINGKNAGLSSGDIGTKTLLIPNDSYLGLGFQEGSAQHWKGMLDEMAVFRRVLSKKDIDYIMTNGLSALAPVGP